MGVLITDKNHWRNGDDGNYTLDVSTIDSNRASVVTSGLPGHFARA